MLLKQTNGLICRREESVLVSCLIYGSKYSCTSISLVTHNWKSGVLHLCEHVLGHMWMPRYWSGDTLSFLSTFRFPVEGNWFSIKRFSKWFSAHRCSPGPLNCKSSILGFFSTCLRNILLSGRCILSVITQFTDEGMDSVYCCHKWGKLPCPDFIAHCCSLCLH